MTVRITHLGSGQFTLAVLAGVLLIAVSAATLRDWLRATRWRPVSS